MNEWLIQISNVKTILKIEIPSQSRTPCNICKGGSEGSFYLEREVCLCVIQGPLKAAEAFSENGKDVMSWHGSPFFACNAGWIAVLAPLNLLPFDATQPRINDDGRSRPLFQTKPLSENCLLLKTRHCYCFDKHYRDYFAKIARI